MSWVDENENEHYPFIEELFGSGLSKSQISKESKRHLASSIEDLKLLSKEELRLLEDFKEEENYSNEYAKFLTTVGNLTCRKR